MSLVTRLARAYVAPYRQFASFKGRSPRMEYWTFALVNFPIAVALGWLSETLGFYDGAAGIGLFDGLFAAFLLLPTISLVIRRLHDSGLSGAWIFVTFVPLAGPIIALVLMLRRSTPGDNQFGPSPYGDPPAPTLPEDGGAPYAGRKGAFDVCPWCGKKNPAGREDCQWCRQPYRSAEVGVRV